MFYKVAVSMLGACKPHDFLRIGIILNLRPNMNQRLSIILLALYWVAMIVGTHVPADYIPPTFNWVDKAYHFAAYAGLAVLIVNAFGFRNVMRHGPSAMGGLLLLLCLHGAIDEVTQSFIPGRFPSVADWIADSLGGSLGLVACWLWGESMSAWVARWRRPQSNVA